MTDQDSKFDSIAKKVLYGNQEVFEEALRELDDMFEDGSAFRVLDEDEEYDFRMWAQANYIPGQAVSPVWHPVVRDECDLMNQGLIIDPGVVARWKEKHP